jgi:acetoin utilization deacetylase AcuC-like enzyme
LNSTVGSKKYNVNIELLSGVSQRVYIYMWEHLLIYMK